MKLYLALSTAEYDGDTYLKWCLYNIHRKMIFQSKVEVASDGIANLLIKFSSIISRIKCLSYDIELYFTTNHYFLSQYYWFDEVIEELKSYQDFTALCDVKEMLKNIVRPVDDSEHKYMFNKAFITTELTVLMDEVQQYVEGCKKVDNGDQL